MHYLVKLRDLNWILIKIPLVIDSIWKKLTSTFFFLVLTCLLFKKYFPIDKLYPISILLFHYFLNLFFSFFQIQFFLFFLNFFQPIYIYIYIYIILLMNRDSPNKESLVMKKKILYLKKLLDIHFKGLLSKIEKVLILWFI